MIHLCLSYSSVQHITCNLRNHFCQFSFLAAFQEQRLLQAVQSGTLQRIKQALNWLKLLNSSKDIGKGGKGIAKGSKKIGIADSHGQIQEEAIGDTVVISNRVLQILHQRSSSNQNVLHICCNNPTYTEKGGQLDTTSLLQDCWKGREGAVTPVLHTHWNHQLHTLLALNHLSTGGFFIIALLTRLYMYFPLL